MTRGTPIFPISRQDHWHPRWPWLAIFVIAVCCIWGNSLVPGTESDSISLGVVGYIQHMLSAAGLPWEWLTNFLVRKAAHFSEYMFLGIIGMQAFAPHRSTDVAPILATVLTLILVPCADETIQLFVSGRSGQITDVLIDCSGAMAGVLLTLLASSCHGTVRKRRSTKRGQDL